MPRPDSPFPAPKPPEDESDSTAVPGGPTFSLDDLPTSTPEAEAVDEEKPFLEIGSTLGGYRLVKQLGAGGMGAVFLAEDERLQRNVALKVMRPEIAARKSSRERFLREARAAARVEHDSIIPILQIGEENGIPFIAMPFLKGMALDERLKRGRPSVLEIIQIGRLAAEALAVAHAQGMIHRDIKPANIWLETAPSNPSGFRVKILDFGLARFSSDEGQLTQSGAVMGTPAYMAPEQARGKPLDGRADLFSLGVVLYEMATGWRPFTGPDTMAVLFSLANDNPPPPNQANAALPPPLSNLIVRMMTKDPEKRIGSAVAVVEILKQIAPEAGSTIVPAPIIESLSPWADIEENSDTDITDPPAPETRTASPVAKRSERRPLDPSAPVERRTGRPKWNVLMGSLAAVAIAAAIVVIIVIIRDKDGNKVAEIKVPDGGSVETKDVVDPKPKPKTSTTATPNLADILASSSWSAPESLGSSINAALNEQLESLTDDERLIVFSRNGRIMASKRSTREEPFPAAKPLGGPFESPQWHDLTMTGDGLEAACTVDKASGKGQEIRYCKRKSLDEPFGEAIVLPPPVNAGGTTRHPVFSSDGLTLAINTTRFGFEASADIVLLRRPSRDKPFGEEERLSAPVNSDRWDIPVWISNDGRVLLTRSQAREDSSSHLWLKASQDGPFVESKALTCWPNEVGTNAWLSPNGDRFYFGTSSLDGEGKSDIWMCRRIPKK